MVPGQVVNRETIEFMRKLDVKEIHGFAAALGLKLLKPAYLETAGGRGSAKGIEQSKRVARSSAA